MPSQPEARIVEHVRSIWKESHKALLSSLGVTEGLVAKAIAHLQHNIIPVVELDRSASESDQVNVVSATMEACRLGTFAFSKVSVMKLYPPWELSCLLVYIKPKRILQILFFY